MERSAAKRLAKLMRTEADRALTSIHSEGYPRPFYVSFLVRDEETWEIHARFGTLSHESHRRQRYCYSDVRVGSPEVDQVQDGGLHDNLTDDDSYQYNELPFSGSGPGVQHGLWLLAESRYREAVESYVTKKSHELTYLNRNRTWPSFPPHAGNEAIHWRPLPQVDVDDWRSYVESCSAVLRRYPRIKQSHVELRARNQLRVFVNTDGALQIQTQPFWELACELWLLSSKGDALSRTISHFVADPAELPTRKQFQAEIRQTVKQLDQLAEADALRTYAGPVLLDPHPAGLLIHEALGHRLEGNRLLSTGEGQTFRRSLGARIVPESLTIRDDPRLNTFAGKTLVGHYHYDDEGVPAQDARLVERGVLSSFISSRAGISPTHQSNGHGRNERHERPISRMAVTIVESEQGLDDAELKRQLIAEVQRQGLPYGIRILRATAGETATESYNFQAFLGQIDLATKVYPDGREEWIRGVDFVGTPLNAIRNIIAVGARRDVDNHYCGAESGWVPVSTISPGMLVAHLELQAKSETPFSPPCYPMPWEQGKR